MTYLPPSTEHAPISRSGTVSITDDTIAVHDFAFTGVTLPEARRAALEWALAKITDALDLDRLAEDPS